MSSYEVQSVMAAMDRCELRYAALVNDGCAESVAADRTFDALESAMLGRDPVDPRDRLFASELRTIIKERNEK